MIPFIVLGAVALAGVALLAIYWKEISAWIGRVMEKLPPSVKENLKGATAFVQKLGVTFKNIMNYYSYNEQTTKWTETIVTKEVDPSEIPKDILKRFESSSKIDISDDLQKQLSLVA